MNSYVYVNADGVYINTLYNTAEYEWHFDNNGYLKTPSLELQGYFKGVDGSTGTVGQVLTRNVNGGVYWADATGGSGGGIVFESVNFPTGTVGDAKGTLAYSTLTNALYLATASYVQQVQTCLLYTSDAADE